MNNTFTPKGKEPLNMAKQGIAIEMIVDITELTREEIKLMLEAEGED